MKTRVLALVGAVIAIAIGVHLAFPQASLGSLIAGLSAAGTFGALGMILDERSEFADATTIPTTLGRSLLGDVMDLGVGRNIGAPGKQLYLVVEIDTAVTSSAAATLQVELVSDAQAAIAVDGTASIHAVTAAIAKASLVAGYRFVIAVPSEGDIPYERYLGVITTVGTTALTAGKANAFLTFTPNESKAYADASN